MRFAHERLAEARLTLDLTQEDLARAAGIDVRTYRRYESGAVNEGGFDVRRAERRRIVDALGAELGLTFDELVLPEAPTGPHLLPPTRSFVGRRALLDELQSWRDHPHPARLIAVVGIGGAGKTALARQLGEGAFVWSFYQDPKVEALVDALLQRLGEALEPAGNRLDRVEAALRRSGVLLLVLDGLEVVQADGSADRAAGEIEDPPLRRLLLALATGLGRVKVLLTSRVPPVDLEACAGYRRIDLPPLSAEESAELLGAFGVPDPAEVATWVGGHALSLAMAGSYLRRGDRKLKDLVDLDLGRARRDDPLARRLLSVLEAHTALLAPEERSVFAALSIFPSGATVEALAGLPLAVAEAELVRAVARLEEVGLVQSDGRRWWLHPLVARFAGALLERGGAALHEAERARLAAGLGTRLDIDDRGALDQVERLVHHTLGAGRPQDAYVLYERVLGGFDHLGLRRGDFARGARLTRAFGEGALPPRDGQRLRYEHGLYALALGDLVGARSAYGRVAAEARATGDPLLCTTALRAVGYTARLQGDFAAALEALAGAIAIVEPMRDRPHLVRARALLGAVLHEQGRFAEARAAFDGIRALGDDPLERRGLWEAEHLVDVGELDLARERTLRNLERCRVRGWPGHVAHCHAVLGAIDARTGAVEAGRAHLAELQGWTERTGEVELVLRAHLLAGELGDAEEARVGAEKARRLGYRPLAERLAGRVPRS